MNKGRGMLGLVDTVDGMQLTDDFGELVSPNVQSFHMVLEAGEVMWTECWLLLWPEIEASGLWE